MNGGWGVISGICYNFNGRRERKRRGEVERGRYRERRIDLREDLEGGFFKIFNINEFRN